MSNETTPTALPKLRFPEFQGEDDWEEKKLSEICEVNPSAASLPETFVYIDLESVESGVLLQKKFISKQGSPSRAQRLLQDGDSIFQMVRPYQKNNYFFRESDDNTYVASTGYAQLRAHQSNEYLFQYLHTSDFVERVLAKCTGSSYPAINSSDLSRIRVVIPGLAEQQKIAATLSSLDDLLTAQSAKLVALQAHKRGLMQGLFPAEGETVPKLRFPEFQEAAEWRETTLGNECNLQDGFSFKSTDFVSTSESTIQVVRITDVNNKNKNSDKVYVSYSFTDNRALNRYLIQEGDLILSLTGAAGFNFFIWNGEKAFLNQRTTRVSPKDVSNNVLKWLLEPLIYNKINSHGEGQNNNLSKEFLNSIEFLIPSEKEQHKIADCLSSLDNRITAQSQKIEALQLHKKGLMQGLFPAAAE